jgi:O-antigen/teichoic acid export membrane protein
MLARILSPEVFGIYAFAQAIITTTKSLPAFGLGTAYVHRSQESEHIDSLNVYFTLISSFTLIWALFLFIASALFVDYNRRWVIWVLIITTFLTELTAPAYSMLVKRVSFLRSAVITFLVALITTVAAIFLALNGWDIWSLLSVDVVTALLLIFGYYVVKPIWVPRLVWSRSIVRYYLSFGSRNVLAGILVQAIDRLDDIWTGYFLGNRPLGFYSRAYTFANYPRRVLLDPIYAVAVGIYAELKNKRDLLSESFFLINSIVVRGSFLISGIAFLVSPEFVLLVLGEKWLPMLGAFRLMIAYTMFDPIGAAIGGLFPSIGKPLILVRSRAIQLIVLAISVPLLGTFYGIDGVASAATFMMIVGTSYLILQSKNFVDISYLRLFGVPLFSLIIGMIIAYGINMKIGLLDFYWQNGILKLFVFSMLYIISLVVIERKQIYRLFKLFKYHVFPQKHLPTFSQGD